MKIKYINISKILLIFMLILIPGAFVFSGCEFVDNLFGGKPEIKIVKEFKTNYYINEKLDVRNGIISYKKGGKTTEKFVSENMITGFDSSALGKKEMVLKYKDASIKIAYSINPIINTNLIYKTENDLPGIIYVKFVPVKDINNKYNLILYNANAGEENGKVDKDEMLNPNDPKWNDDEDVDRLVFENVEFKEENGKYSGSYIINNSDKSKDKSTFEITSFDRIKVSVSYTEPNSDEYKPRGEFYLESREGDKVVQLKNKSVFAYLDKTFKEYFYFKFEKFDDLKNCYYLESLISKELKDEYFNPDNASWTGKNIEVVRFIEEDGTFLIKVYSEDTYFMEIHCFELKYVSDKQLDAKEIIKKSDTNKITSVSEYSLYSDPALIK